VFDLIGAEAEVEALGVIAVGQQDVHVVNTLMCHDAPNCRSQQNYRGIANQSALVNCLGKTWVTRQGQLTDADQSLAQLILDQRARVIAHPELEIYADDVKCTHGATSGYFDPEALFYLQSRGLPQAHARALLVDAFKDVVYDQIGPNDRDWVHSMTIVEEEA